MSCIKFPSSKSDLTKMPSKESTSDPMAINLQIITAANQTFNRGYWSHAITNQTLDFVDYVNGRYQAGCASVVRVQMKSGEFHEAVGYHSAEGSSKQSAIQKVRLASFNDGLKKALTFFDSNFANKLNNSSNRPVSPLPVESSSNKSNKVGVLSNRSVSPQPIESSKSQLPENQAKVVNTLVEEAFLENIPMSQADALMEIVEMDQLFDKDQPTDVIKPSVDKGKEKAVTTDSVHLKSVEEAQSNGKIVDTLADTSKRNTVNGIKIETKSETSKSGASKAMTDEEMRLERKRKQREMQEEFKRQQEIKKKHTENGNKQAPNPRY